MSSSSSTSSAASAFPSPAAENQLPAAALQLSGGPPVQAAPSEQLCYVHCHFCDTVLVVSVPSSSLFKTVTVRCGYCSSLLTVNMRGILFPGSPTGTAATALAATASVSTTTVTTTTAAATTPPPPAAAPANHGQFMHLSQRLNLAAAAPSPPQCPHHSLLDEISSANPSLQLLEQHGLGGLIAGAGSCRTTSPPPPPPAAAPAATPAKGTKEPSSRTNPAANRPPEKRQRVPSAYNRFIKDEIQRIKAGNPDISHREAFSAAAKNWAHFPHIHFGLMPDHHGLRKTSLLPQDLQRKDGLLKNELYVAAAANMGIAPY